MYYGFDKDTKSKYDLAKLHTPKVFLIQSVGWSSATTTKNGRAFYTYVVNVTKIHNNSVKREACGATLDALPTEAQQEAFNLCLYGKADTEKNTITFYALEKPKIDFYCALQGVE